MPLMILGLLLLIGLLVYSIVRYLSSDDPGERDERPVRERYPHAFHVRSSDAKEDGKSSSEDEVIETESYVDEDSLRGDIDYMIRNITEQLKKRTRNIDLDLDSIRRKFGDADDDDGDNTVEFPKDNIENEKKKRGIH